jgi:hypothetical protein
MPYDFLPLVASLLIFYFFSATLVKVKAISLLIHRRIWNAVLLASFLVSGISGIVLVIKVNYGWTPVWPFNMLYWHVEAGIAMAIVSVFHFGWHLYYFKSIFSGRRAAKDKER